METVNEIKKEFTTALKERLSSPFYGYFIISWIIWNWELIYVTLFVSANYIFERDYMFKSEYIFNLINDNSVKITMINMVIGPLSTVAFFVWVSPFITHLVYRKVRDDKWKLNLIDENLKKNMPKKGRRLWTVRLI